MKKVIFCITLALSGMMTACVEKNEAVDADSKPSWLGESIYQELNDYLDGVVIVSNQDNGVVEIGGKKVKTKNYESKIFSRNSNGSVRIIRTSQKA